MMTSFVTKKGSGSICRLGSAILNYCTVFILLKTRQNRVIFNRKLDLNAKGCLESKKSAKYAVPR